MKGCMGIGGSDPGDLIRELWVKTEKWKIAKNCFKHTFPTFAAFFLMIAHESDYF
jgi:hypothetical protein